MPRPMYPTKNVSDRKKSRLVYGICMRSGFGSDPATGELDPTAYDWWDPSTHQGDVNHATFAAAEAHYDEVLMSSRRIDPYYDHNPVVTIAGERIKADKMAAISNEEI